MNWDMFALLLFACALGIIFLLTLALSLLLNALMKNHRARRFRLLFAGGLFGIIPAAVYFNIFIDSFPNGLLNTRGIILVIVWLVSTVAGALAFNKYKGTSS
jgi:Mn2+/Fe2+ NRAMP family transporter